MTINSPFLSTMEYVNTYLCYIVYRCIYCYNGKVQPIYVGSEITTENVEKFNVYMEVKCIYAVSYVNTSKYEISYIYALWKACKLLFSYPCCT